MEMNGLKCGFCGKGRFKAITYAVEPGITVDAGKCEKCGEIAVSEDVMGKIEALRAMNSEQRSIVQVGSSLAALIPAAFVRKLHLKAKDRIFVFEKNGEIVIKTKLV
ncbi:AbrB/MazE/SpoVT family DNA-binding domain-containing protein [Candidatus Micrarchaeota archaeon]|nr:AbrB/MazE/SpoVT family DNA-binding domain-containing protein [Candidatus Micrarchaeota archaeon]